MQSKEKYVCINCGYSADINQYRMAAAPAPAAKPAAATKAAPKPAPKAAVAPAPAPVPVTVPPPAPEWIEPQRDEVVIAKRKLEAVIGDKKVNRAEQGIVATTNFGKGFYETYMAELQIMMKGETGKAIKVIGIILGGILLLVLLFTVHPVPGL